MQSYLFRTEQVSQICNFISQICNFMSQICNFMSQICNFLFFRNGRPISAVCRDEVKEFGDFGLLLGVEKD